MKSIAEKLLIKQGKSVCVVNPPEDLTDLLGPIPERVSLTTGADPKTVSGTFDVLLAFIPNRATLENQLLDLKRLVAPKGIFWLAYYKGTSKIKTDINRDSIWAYAKPLGMEGVAMIAINDDWSGFRVKIID